MQEMANVSRKSIAFCRFVIAILFWLVVKIFLLTNPVMLGVADS